MADNPVFNRILQEYDQTIVNNPLWVNVKDIESLINAGDRTVRNKAKEHNWKKKYAKVDGSPMVYFARADVEAFLEREGLLHKKAIEEATTVQQPPEESPAHFNGTSSATPPSDDFNRELSRVPNGQLTDFLSFHKNTLTQVVELERACAQEKGRTFGLKINIGWLCFLVCAAAGFAYFYFMRSEKLLNANSELSTKYFQTQEELYKSKASLLEKDQLIHKLSTANVTQ